MENVLWQLHNALLVLSQKTKGELAVCIGHIFLKEKNLNSRSSFSYQLALLFYSNYNFFQHTRHKSFRSSMYLNFRFFLYLCEIKYNLWNLSLYLNNWYFEIPGKDIGWFYFKGVILKRLLYNHTCFVFQLILNYFKLLPWHVFYSASEKFIHFG